LRIFCIDQLRRLPEELEAPLSAVYRSMIAYEAVTEMRHRELERQRKGF
jgi:hypothetical protein